MNIDAIGHRGKSILAPLMLTRLLPPWVDHALGAVLDGMLATLYVLLLLPVCIVICLCLMIAVYIRCAGVLLAR